MTTETRQRGIQVYPMPTTVGGPPIFGTYALLVREDGGMRMVHTEGVAYKVSADKPWRWNDQQPSEEFTPGELLLIALDVEPVDLADWVRSFGARLESNFNLIAYWNNHLEEPV